MHDFSDQAHDTLAFFQTHLNRRAVRRASNFTGWLQLYTAVALASITVLIMQINQMLSWRQYGIFMLLCSKTMKVPATIFLSSQQSYQKHRSSKNFKNEFLFKVVAPSDYTSREFDTAKTNPPRPQIKDF
jgi:hypothetical protein